MSKYTSYNVRTGVLRRQLINIKRVTRGTVAGVAALLFIAAVPISAGAAGNNAPNASFWHVGYYNPSGRALSMASAPATTNGTPTFNFTSQPNTALLTTDQKGKNGDLLGNQSGSTINATFTVSGAAASDFTYYGQNGSSGPGVATVRLFFESTHGGFAYTNYWWSDAAFQPLGNGQYTLTAKLDPTMAWSDWNGQPSSANADAFNAAANNITSIGLSFGGGYFFENGVGTLDGNGSFTLDSYTVN